MLKSAAVQTVRSVRSRFNLMSNSRFLTRSSKFPLLFFPRRKCTDIMNDAQIPVLNSKGSLSSTMSFHARGVCGGVGGRGGGPPAPAQVILRKRITSCSTGSRNLFQAAGGWRRLLHDCSLGDKEKQFWPLEREEVVWEIMRNNWGCRDTLQIRSSNSDYIKSRFYVILY